MIQLLKTLTLQPTILKTLRLTFWAVLLISLSNCKGYTPPLVTLNQIDTIHNQVNPFKITKYDKVSCKLELEPQPSYPLMGAASPLMGGVCLTKEDYAKIKDSVEAECINNKPKANNVNATHDLSVE